jgi:hypothetical protein
MRGRLLCECMAKHGEEQRANHAAAVGDTRRWQTQRALGTAALEPSHSGRRIGFPRPLGGGWQASRRTACGDA